jgi:hypothetical protein
MFHYRMPRVFGPKGKDGTAGRRELHGETFHKYSVHNDYHDHKIAGDNMGVTWGGRNLTAWELFEDGGGGGVAYPEKNNKAKRVGSSGPCSSRTQRRVSAWLRPTFRGSVVVPSSKSNDECWIFSPDHFTFMSTSARHGHNPQLGKCHAVMQWDPISMASSWGLLRHKYCTGTDSNRR